MILVISCSQFATWQFGAYPCNSLMKPSCLLISGHCWRQLFMHWTIPLVLYQLLSRLFRLYSPLELGASTILFFSSDVLHFDKRILWGICLCSFIGPHPSFLLLKAFVSPWFNLCFMFVLSMKLCIMYSWKWETNYSCCLSIGFVKIGISIKEEDERHITCLGSSNI